MVQAHVWPAPLSLRPDVHRSALLATSLHVGTLAATRAEVRRFAWPVPAVVSHARSEVHGAGGLAVLGRAQPMPPFATTSHRVTGLALAGQAHDLPIGPRVKVRRDLAAMRARPVERRGVSPRLLSEAQGAHWRKRLSDAKRVPVNQVELLAVFPDVPIVGDQPVQYAHGALSYLLPDAPVPLSTVVIAKHATTGALLVGRFARA